MSRVCDGYVFNHLPVSTGKIYNMTQVMGILNVTPDSFSDGGRFSTIDSALFQAKQMIADGADIIDIGGESTRPGAASVSLSEEINRVIPVVEKLVAEFDTVISVDTSKAELMSLALSSGARMINDVRALQEEGALEACVDSDALICLMHMQGQPRTMQKEPIYIHIFNEVTAFFEDRIKACESAGIRRERLILDPGFGFGKTLEHNLELLAKLPQLSSFNLPLLVGLSRKSMLGALLDDAPVEERLNGSLSAAVVAAMKGSAIIRVHDVKETVEALKIVRGVQLYE